MIGRVCVCACVCVCLCLGVCLARVVGLISWAGGNSYPIMGKHNVSWVLCGV